MTDDSLADQVGGAATGPGMSWELLDTEVAYQGFLLMQSRRYRLPDGRIARWDILAGGASVSVLAITEAGDVVLARQYRPGPDRVLVELPGGIVDPGEDPATAAARELLEETGYAAATVVVLGGTWLAGFSNIYRYAALATGCTRLGEPQAGSEEFCQPVELNRAEYLAVLRSGELTDSDTGYRVADHLGWLR
jgi:ADP-ribose pyrophosphatase